MSTTNEPIDEQLWDAIDKCVERNDDSCDDRELRALAECLRDEALSGKVTLWYPAGYCFYCLKSRTFEPSSQALCEECLHNAIRQNANADLAAVYLVFHNYDIGRYKQVADYEAKINYDRLEETLQLRCREVCICALIRSQGLKGSATELAAYAEYVRGLRTPDPMPFLLEQCLSTVQESEFEIPIVMSALRDLDGAYEFLGKDYFSRKVF